MNVRCIPVSISEGIVTCLQVEAALTMLKTGRAFIRRSLYEGLLEISPERQIVRIVPKLLTALGIFRCLGQGFPTGNR